MGTGRREAGRAIESILWEEGRLGVQGLQIRGPQIARGEPGLGTRSLSSLGGDRPGRAGRGIPGELVPGQGVGSRGDGSR